MWVTAIIESVLYFLGAPAISAAAVLVVIPPIMLALLVGLAAAVVAKRLRQDVCDRGTRRSASWVLAVKIYTLIWVLTNVRSGSSTGSLLAGTACGRLI
jgi:hypothetical protein